MQISNDKIRALALCGILSPIVYVITVAMGGFLDPTYSHIGKTVSELVERGAPNRDLLDIMLVVYNLLIIPFAVGLYFGLKKSWSRKSGFGCLGSDGYIGYAGDSVLSLRCRWSIGNFYGIYAFGGGWFSCSLHVYFHAGILELRQKGSLLG